ncbi:hypothetical protein B1R27_08125 [Streptomyces sp. GKU 895]|nr:hypothetical protein B1R27_08125 [Streptomyces sp. GKU 895]
MCAGQLSIEQRLGEALAEYARDVEPLDEGVLGIRAASAGPACLHLDAEPILLGYLVHRLAPGLRLVRGTPGRLELRRRDGHGRLVFPLDAAAEHVLDVWRRDLATVHPNLVPVHFAGSSHPDAAESRKLRRLLRDLPVVPSAHDHPATVQIMRASLNVES